MGMTSVEPGTDSCFSRGSTSRNQPIHPQTVKIAPMMLTGALVTRPANSNATPKAATIGQAVGAGSSMLPGEPARVSVRSVPIPPTLSLASNDVNDSENHNPHCIHEMPVNRQHVDTISVLLLNIPKQRERHHCGKADKPNNHVKPVQSDQRIVCCSEQVRAYGQPIVVNQPIPFMRRPVKKCCAEYDRCKPPSFEGRDISPAQCLNRKVNRETAGEQTNCIKDRYFKDLLRRRPGQTLGQLEEVRHDKDYENRRLGDDQSEHCHVPSRRQSPLEFRLAHRDWCRAHF